MDYFVSYQYKDDFGWGFDNAILENEIIKTRDDINRITQKITKLKNNQAVIIMYYREM